MANFSCDYPDTPENRAKYRKRVARNMRRWTNATLNREDAFSDGKEGPWEAEEWREALNDELRRRQYL